MALNLRRRVRRLYQWPGFFWGPALAVALSLSTRAATEPPAGLAGPPSTAKTPRLAIVSEPALQAEANVLTVSLSKLEGLALVERDEIAKVVQEQSLTSQGLTAMEGRRLGQLLHADGLVLLRLVTLNTNRALNARVIAVDPGVVIGSWNDCHPLPGLEPWSSNLTELVRAQLPKMAVKLGEAVPLSVLNLRSATATYEARKREREWTFFLRQRLLQEPAFFVLEREQMSALALEKDIAGETTNRFWTGSYVIDGTLTEGADASIVLTLHVNPPAAAPAFDLVVSGRRDASAQLLEAVVTNLVQRLGRPGASPPWDHLVEARRFFNEARSALRANLPEEALAAAEASQALGLRSDELSMALARLYCHFCLPVHRDFSLRRLGIAKIPENDVRLDYALASLERYLPMLERKSAPLEGSQAYWGWEDLTVSLPLKASRIVRWYWEGGLYASKRADLDLLRQRIREMVSVLQAQRPSQPPISYLPIRQFIPGIAPASSAYRCYGASAAYAPYWYDDPEQVLQAYRTALNFQTNATQYREIEDIRYAFVFRDGATTTTGQTPLLLNWGARSSEELDRRWRNFVDQYVQSPHLEAQVDGLFLQWLETGLSTERQRELRERTKTALWDWRYAMATNLTISARAVELYQKIYLSQTEDFRFWHLDFQLKHACFFDQGFFHTMFGRGFTQAAYAQRLLDDLTTFRARVFGPVDPRSNDLRPFIAFERGLLTAFAQFATSPPATPIHTLTAVWPSPAAMSSMLAQGGLPPGTVLGLRELLYRDGVLWASLCRTNACYLARIDPVSRETTFLPVIFKPGQYNGESSDPTQAFEVSSKYIFFTAGGSLARYDRQTKEWKTREVPPSYCPWLSLIGTNLYYAFPSGIPMDNSGICRINSETLDLRVLASSRRKPAQTSLDDCSPYRVNCVFAGPDQKLFAQVLFPPDPQVQKPHSLLYHYDEASANFTEFREDILLGSAGFRPIPFKDGTLMQPIFHDACLAFLLFNNSKIEFLFDDPYGQFPVPRSRPVRPGRWPVQKPVWPSSPPQPVMATRDGQNLWFLIPRIEKQKAPYNLCYFTAAEKEPMVIPLQLDETDTKPFYGFDPSPGLLMTPHGLVLFGLRNNDRDRNCSGFWLLPNEELHRLTNGVAGP